MIAVVDYGAGNLHSVCNALEVLGARFQVTQEAEEIGNADRVILPGVGHFAQMMEALDRLALRNPIVEAAREKPLIGICLGMQALFESSEEAPGAEGLALIRGRVMRFRGDLRVPHMGWSRVDFRDGYSDWFYFANSFYAPVAESTSGVATYADEFTAAVREGNVTGFQFHPEKSGPAGILLLSAWCNSAG